MKSYNINNFLVSANILLEIKMSEVNKTIKNDKKLVNIDDYLIQVFKNNNIKPVIVDSQFEASGSWIPLLKKNYKKQYKISKRKTNNLLWTKQLNEEVI